MIDIKKIIFSLAIITILLGISSPLLTFASSTGSSVVFDPTYDKQAMYLDTKTGLGNNNPLYISYKLVNTSLTFLGVITLTFIVIGGFMWVFAAGEEEKITKAQNLIKGATVGLLIVLASYGLAQFIFTSFTKIATTPVATPTTVLKLI
ncbi:MAG: hypothetical protein V1898_02110 [Patescibacteria group bacterium]